jgi:hypothetical protein
MVLIIDVLCAHLFRFLDVFSGGFHLCNTLWTPSFYWDSTILLVVA